MDRRILIKKLFYCLYFVCNYTVGDATVPSSLESCLDLLRECSQDHVYIPRIFNPKLSLLLTDLSFDELISLMQQADEYGNNYVINGVGAIVVDRLESIETDKKHILSFLQNKLTPHAYAFITKYINFKKHKQNTRACTTPEFSIAEYVSLYDVPLDHLGNIGILRFDNKNLTSIYGLQNISLSNVGLVILNNNCIVGNTLDPQFPSDPFVGLPNTYNLFFTQNLIESLPTTFFKSIPAIRTITLGKNNLTTIPQALLSGIDQLALLSLSSNKITSISNDIFVNMPLLDTLYIDNNLLIGISDELFNKNPNLRKLYINNNQITNLPSNLFDNLTELVYLDLGYNSLTDFIPDYIRPGAEVVLIGNPLTQSQQDTIKAAYPENNFVF